MQPQLSLFPLSALNSYLERYRLSCSSSLLYFKKYDPARWRELWGNGGIQEMTCSASNSWNITRMFIVGVFPAELWFHTKTKQRQLSVVRWPQWDISNCQVRKHDAKLLFWTMLSGSVLHNGTDLFRTGYKIKFIFYKFRKQWMEKSSSKIFLTLQIDLNLL